MHPCTAQLFAAAASRALCGPLDAVESDARDGDLGVIIGCVIIRAGVCHRDVDDAIS